MNIGFLVPSTFAAGNPGNGILAQARYQARALEQLGHSVVEMTPWSPVRKGEIDVLHYFLGGYGLAGIEQTARHLGCPLIFAPIIDSNHSNFAYRSVARLGNIIPRLDTTPAFFRHQALAAAFTVVRSRHEYLRVEKGLGVPADKIRVVLNGITPASDTDGERARKLFDLPERFILTVSAYTQTRKNVQRLVEAAGALDYPLVIAGYAPEGKQLEALRENVRKYPKIRLLGFQSRDALNDLMAACEVFALPSMHEGTGLVALEAGALGAKIVITQNGGPEDYFLNYADYVAPENVDSIKSALQRAWERPAETGLEQHIRANLSWAKSAEALLDVYRASLESPTGRLNA